MWCVWHAYLISVKFRIILGTHTCIHFPPESWLLNIYHTPLVKPKVQNSFGTRNKFQRSESYSNPNQNLVDGGHVTKTHVCEFFKANK